MGANVSTQNIESMTKTINKTLTDVSQTFSTTATSTNISRQDMELIIGEATGCNFLLSQDSKSNLAAMSEFSNEISNEVANQLKNTLKEELAQIVKQKNEGINFGQTNVSALNTISNTTLENNIENIINTSISSTISNTVDSGQKIKITIGKLTCPANNSSFIVTQEMIIDQISTNIANNLVKNTLTNIADNDVTKKITQTSDQANAGLTFGGMIFLLIAAAAFTFFFGYKIMCYIIPIFIAVVAYGIYYYSQTNLKLTLGVLIVCEIILICLELYFIYKAVFSKNVTLPTQAQSLIKQASSQVQSLLKEELPSTSQVQSLLKEELPSTSQTTSTQSTITN